MEHSAIDDTIVQLSKVLFEKVLKKVLIIHWQVHLKHTGCIKRFANLSRQMICNVLLTLLTISTGLHIP